MHNAKAPMAQHERISHKIKSDFLHYAKREKETVSFTFVARMLLVTPGFQFVFSRRIQELLACIPVIGRPLRRIVWWMTCLLFGSELALACRIAGGLYIPHPFGIVVGVSDIGRDVTILQNVTIGQKNRVEFSEPRIEDGAYLAAGSVILGNITIGRNSIIGANSVVTKNVPENSMAVGVPARILTTE